MRFPLANLQGCGLLSESGNQVQTRGEAIENSELKQSYATDRPDLRRHIPATARRVLDLGCYTGAVGAALKLASDVLVIGVEHDTVAAKAAHARLDEVIVGDLDSESVWNQLTGRQFDVVIAGDVLEHCRDPWHVLARAREMLVEGGICIISLPNVAHYSTLVALLRREWPMNARGIHDATHLRWFAQNNVEAMIREAGLHLLKLDRTYRLLERPHPVNRLARFFAVPGLRNLLTHQFIAVCRRR
jgi:2-polyprenyl-3-methyl-5-hydroxy-6-metoxy-1,4-benzoquinol methylase